MTESELFNYLAQCNIGRIEVMFKGYSPDDPAEPESDFYHWFVYDVDGKYLRFDEDFLEVFGSEGDNQDQPPLYDLLSAAYHKRADVFGRHAEHCPLCRCPGDLRHPGSHHQPAVYRGGGR
jgi:hypothetical protein